MFKNFLKKLNGKTKFFAILGDHDRPKARGMAPHKLFDDQIETLGVTGTAEHREVEVNGERVLIVGISNLSRSYMPLLMDELGKLKKIERKFPSILVMHQAIDKFLPFEDAWEVAFTALPKTFDYYAMGHLHSRIKASVGQGELAYPGSSEIIRKDEIASWQKSGKGFFIVDIQDGDVEIKDVNLRRIRPQIKCKINYSNFDSEVEDFVANLDTEGKKPIVHIRVEGKEIDRQRVHEVINAGFSGKVLTLRTQIIEESQQKLPEVKPGAFNINQVLSDYFKEEQTSKFAIELFKNLREGDTEGAKDVTAEFYEIFLKKVK
jgi:exonuclease SbcD